MRRTGGIRTKVFDVQSQEHTFVTYQKCSYTQFYKAKTSTLINIFDLFTI